MRNGLQPMLVGLAIIVAGCAASDASANIELQALDELGAVTGVVVDESLSPIPGIFVVLREGGASEGGTNTTTNAAGEFAFRALTPTIYVVLITDPRYANVTQDVTVVAGEVATTKIILTGLPGKVPYKVVFVKQGLINCNFPIIVESLTCGVFGPPTKDFRHEVPVGHQLLVIEQTWPNPEESMTLWVERRHPPPGNQTDRILIKLSAPAMRIEMLPGQSFCCSTAQIPKVPVPPSEENFTLQLRSFYAGKYQKEINQTVGFVCVTYYGSDACRGVGAALDFRFQQYVTAFVNYRPANPKQYTALPDS